MAVTAAVYRLLTDDEAGSLLLALSFMALLFVGAYLAVLSRRHGMRPEDIPDPDPDAGIGEIGYFPSSSIWPFLGGCGAVVLAVGLVFGIWLSVFGGMLVGAATLGYAVEANSKA